MVIKHILLLVNFTDLSLVKRGRIHLYVLTLSRSLEFAAPVHQVMAVLRATVDSPVLNLTASFQPSSD